MPNMLTQDDLKAIGTLLDEKVPVLVKPLIKDAVDKAVDDIVGGVGEIFDEHILPRFDKIDAKFKDVDTRLIRIEAGMVTKDYLDDKLSHYVEKPRLNPLAA